MTDEEYVFYHCSPCDKTFTGRESEAEHVNSEKHLKRIRSNTENRQDDTALRLTASEKEKTKVVSDENLECKICCKSFTGIENKEEHLRSEKHQRKLMAQNGDITH